MPPHLTGRSPGTAPSTCTRCAGPVRRRLAAIGVLLFRFALLMLAVLACLLFRTYITQFLVFVGWLVAACAMGAAELAAFRSFARTWKGDWRERSLRAPIPIAIRRNGDVVHYRARDPHQAYSGLSWGPDQPGRRQQAADPNPATRADEAPAGGDQ
jgi:hypothetical protein